MVGGVERRQRRPVGALPRVGCSAIAAAARRDALLDVVAGALQKYNANQLRTQTLAALADRNVSYNAIVRTCARRILHRWPALHSGRSNRRRVPAAVWRHGAAVVAILSRASKCAFCTRADRLCAWCALSHAAAPGPEPIGGADLDLAEYYKEVALLLVSPVGFQFGLSIPQPREASVATLILQPDGPLRRASRTYVL